MLQLLLTIATLSAAPPRVAQDVPALPGPPQAAAGTSELPAPPTGTDEVVDAELRGRDRPSGALDAEARGPLGRALLEWGGVRPFLAERGFEMEVFYTVDGSWLASGAAPEDDPLTRGLLDATFTYRTEPLLGWSGGTFHAGFQWFHGVDASTRYGVVQPITNIDAERRTQLGRIWFEQHFASSGTRVRLGKIDANSQFAFVDGAASFLHSSMGVSPTVYLMPTYPDSAFGLTVVQPIGRASLSAGVFDGALASGVRTGRRGASTVFESPSEAFLIGEAALGWDGGRVALGAWRSTAELTRFDGAQESGTGGLYAVAEQVVWRASDRGRGECTTFLQLGSADGDVSAIDEHLGFGLAWSDAAEGGTHSAGLGVSRAGLTSATGAGFSEAAETAVELYYGFEPVEWLRLKPDLQFISDPGGDASLDDAWILTLRATLAL